MANIPVRMERFAAAFNEAAREVQSCDSSGSEHSADLFDLVNSFLERETRERMNDIEGARDCKNKDIHNDDGDHLESDFDLEMKIQDSLKDLFDGGNHVVGCSIREEVEEALRESGGINVLSPSSPDFKRRLMARLRDRGLDAGLCKSKWEKNGHRSPGQYEYIDVNASGNRYIIEVFLAGEFTIARPTSFYASLLKSFPHIFVAKPEELKQVVRLMCDAIRPSMKAAQIQLPPWRRLSYMQAKWFGTYKRTTNEMSSKSTPLVGFAPVVGSLSFHCREDFAAKGGLRIGNLAAALR